MATFQELRSYLETHHEELAHALDAEQRENFQRSYERLSRDWNGIPDDNVNYQLTAREMGKYPAVWQVLVDAGIVETEHHSVPVPKPSYTEPVTMAVAHGTKRPAPSVEEKEDPRNRKPSQQVVDRLALNREVITNTIGGLIVLVTLIIALVTIFSVNNASTLAAAKDVLLFMNGLVGVVLGYYFGRVPGDAHADKAENEARVARRDRDQVVATVRTILDDSGTPSAERGGGSDGVHLSSRQVENLRLLLRKYSE